MTFFKRGFIVVLALAFAATPLFVQTAEAKVTKGQASVAKRSGKLYINQRQYDKAMEQYMMRQKDAPTIPRCSIIWVGFTARKSFLKR